MLPHPVTDVGVIVGVKVIVGVPVSVGVNVAVAVEGNSGVRLGVLEYRGVIVGTSDGVLVGHSVAVATCPGMVAVGVSDGTVAVAVAEGSIVPVAVGTVEFGVFVEVEDGSSRST